jgi:hypothetical protein
MKGAKRMANGNAEFVDIGGFSVAGEELTTPIQGDDYVEFKTIEPGNYLSANRTVQATKYDDGNFGFRLSFASGLTNVDTQKFEKGTKFLAKTVTTRLYTTEKGSTSSAAEYLKKVGLYTKGMNLADVKEAMVESQALPVELFVSRTNKGVKQTDGSYLNGPIDPETGESKGLKLQDFNLGTKEEPIWAEQVEIDGQIYQAKAIVGSFRKVSA